MSFSWEVIKCINHASLEAVPWYGTHLCVLLPNKNSGVTWNGRISEQGREDGKATLPQTSVPLGLYFAHCGQSGCCQELKSYYCYNHFLRGKSSALGVSLLKLQTLSPEAAFESSLSSPKSVSKLETNTNISIKVSFSLPHPIHSNYFV